MVAAPRFSDTISFFSLWGTGRFLIPWKLFIKKKKKTVAESLMKSKSRPINMLGVTRAADELQCINSLWKLEMCFQIDFQIMNLLFWRTFGLKWIWSLNYTDSCKQIIFIHFQWNVYGLFWVSFSSSSSRKNTSNVCRKLMSFLNPQTSSSDMRWAVNVKLWRCIASSFERSTHSGVLQNSLLYE